MSTYCFLPVESTPRELDYKLNMARYLCAAGFDVIIGNPPFIRDELKYKNYRGVFLEKGLNPTPEYYQLLKDKGILVYDHSDEGVANPVYSITYPPTIAALELMQKIFIWGEKQKNTLIDLNSNAKIAEKYSVVGSPAFDLCCPKFRPYHKQFKPKSIPDSYILVNTNFASANGYNMDSHLEACPSVSPETYKAIIKSFERETKQYEFFKPWLHSIIKNNPNETFLIRPHPSELKSVYETDFGQYKNVFVSKEGNVNHVIAGAKLVLHKDCTTALQSYLMGVPVISLGGDQINSTYEKWSIAFGATPNTLEEAETMIAYLLTHTKWDAVTMQQIDTKAHEIIQGNFHAIGNSSQSIVDTMKKDAAKILAAKHNSKLTDSRTLMQKFKLLVRKCLPLHYKVPIVSKEILVPYTKAELLSKLTYLESIDPVGVAYKIEWLFPNTYKISQRNKSQSNAKT